MEPNNGTSHHRRNRRWSPSPRAATGSPTPGTDDIIIFPSRRRPPSEPTPEIMPSPLSGRWLALTVVLAFGALLGLIFLAGNRERHAVAAISSAHRAAIFDRAHSDLNETCRLAEASREPLRQHCVDQASFVLLFPECDAACGEMARQVLPHAHR
jgi:cytochrome b pre-mRNA-processing protein 3